MKTSREKHQQFYLVVYTQTDAQVERYHCGAGLDLGLNEMGLEEARKLARRFKKNPLKIKRMISSPELRAIQMADVLHDEIKAKMSITRDFADQFLGDLEGKPLPSEKRNGSARPELHEPIQDPPRGENPAVFLARVDVGLEKVLQEPLLTLVVTHPRVARAILKIVGLGAEAVEPGTLYSVDIPAGEGIAHLRQV